LSCSSSEDCRSNLSSGSFTDTRDGQVYKYAEIGCQTWMAENLNYKTPKSICNEKAQENCDKYGRLYNRSESMNACPKGWHLPNEKEWCAISDCGEGQYSSGKRLKAMRGWDKYEGRDGNGTDNYGFSALPGGAAYYKGYLYGFDYSYIGSIGYWWIATENYYDFSVILLGSGGDETVARKTSSMSSDFFSIRCIKGFGDYSDKEEPKIFSFKDSRDEKMYKYVIIGTQTWMAENLNYESTESKCYNNKPSYCEKYGRLYNWEDAKGVCPSGWHLPSRDEFDVLVNYVGQYEASSDEELKATSGWYYGDGTDNNGTDNYGFNALPAGHGMYEDSTYVFYNVSLGSALWSTGEIDDKNARCEEIGNVHFPSGGKYLNGDDKRSLLSVRCIKN
jgi:uncharacterized protein (TIGR02145 family)